jgi:hypothetical protein
MTVETAPPRLTRGVAFRRAAADPALLGALILALVFCLYGIHWAPPSPGSRTKWHTTTPSRTTEG